MEKNNKETSKIEELKKRLDSRNFSSAPRDDIESPSKKSFDGVRRDWSQDKKEDQQGVLTPEKALGNKALNQMANRKRNFLKIFLTGSIVFFVVALAVALIVIFGGGNIISSENVEISASGPSLISGGEVLSLSIVVSNRNTTALELADLIIEYPEGTRSPENLSVEVPRERFSLGNIGAGDEVDQEIRAVIFGEEGSREKIKMTVEYRVAGSNAIFFKEKEYEIEISSSPISFSIESLTDVNSGKEISLDVTLRSNSNNLLEDIMFTAEYPFGFIFSNSVPRPSFDQNIWKMGDLSPGEERNIKIIGTIEGQDGEERVFRFFGGIQSKKDERELETAFFSSTKSIFIKKPFLALDLLINGNTSENNRADLGDSISVDILWENNLPTSVANVEIEAVLSGDFDENSIFVDRGFYNSIDNTIFWNQDRNPSFESLRPGENGRVSFRFDAQDFAENSLINPEVLIDVNVRGRRLSESGVSEEIVSSARGSVRFNTNLSLVPRAVHFSGPISNSGPIPPKAETETTYTVIWTLNNSVNEVSNAVVKAKIPSYVRWTGNTSGFENITYNSVSREINWDAGSINSSSISSSKEVAFQLALTPSLSQIGQTPILINNVRVVGKDDFTGTVLDITKGELTTKISTDPSYKIGDERVVE